MWEKQLLFQIHISDRLQLMPTTVPFPQLGHSRLSREIFPEVQREHIRSYGPWIHIKNILTALCWHPLDDGLALTYHLLPLKMNRKPHAHIHVKCW